MSMRMEQFVEESLRSTWLSAARRGRRFSRSRAPLLAATTVEDRPLESATSKRPWFAAALAAWLAIAIPTWAAEAVPAKGCGST